MSIITHTVHDWKDCAGLNIETMYLKGDRDAQLGIRAVYIASVSIFGVVSHIHIFETHSGYFLSTSN